MSRECVCLVARRELDGAVVCLRAPIAAGAIAAMAGPPLAVAIAWRSRRHVARVAALRLPLLGRRSSTGAPQPLLRGCLGGGAFPLPRPRGRYSAVADPWQWWPLLRGRCSAAAAAPRPPPRGRCSAAAVPWPLLRGRRAVTLPVRRSAATISWTPLRGRLPAISAPRPPRHGRRLAAAAPVWRLGGILGFLWQPLETVWQPCW